MSDYAVLQLYAPPRHLPAEEHLIYLISSCMDNEGLIPCGRESAERTIRIAAAGDNCRVIFDDEADRLNVKAMNSLGRAVTRSLPATSWAIGIMGERDTRLLRLYKTGQIVDTYITSPGSMGKVGRIIACHGKAVKWRALADRHSSPIAVGEAFLLGEDNAVEGFKAIRTALNLHDSCAYGFKSVDDSDLQSIITLYFCASNHVRQPWYGRLLRPLTGRSRARAGATFGKS